MKELEKNVPLRMYLLQQPMKPKKKKEEKEVNLEEDVKQDCKKVKEIDLRPKLHSDEPRLNL